MSGRGKARAAASSSPVTPSRTKTTPMIRAPDAISDTPSPDAMAIAPNAFSGWTGTGSR